MFKKKLHLHSMMVHVILALAPLAAVAFVFLKKEITVMSFEKETYELLIGISIVLMLLVSLPSWMTGVYERGHIYAKWHSTHKIKLLFSFVLVLALVGELFILATQGLENTELMGPFGILLIGVNNVTCFFLGMYGLKISLGSQSFAKTSYVPDLFKKEPVDILTQSGVLSKEEPVYIDLYEENR